MVAMKGLAAIVFFALGVTAGSISTKAGKCAFPDIDLEDEVDKLIERFPEGNFPYTRRGFTPLLPGFEIGDLNMTGINKIKRSGPVVPYCLKGKSMVQVDLVNVGDVDFIFPWRSCSGQSGKGVLNADYSRFTAQLSVDNEGRNGKYLQMIDERPNYPIITYNVKFVMEGLGEGFRVVTKVLSKLFPSLLLDLWVQSFFLGIREAMRAALQETNNVL